MFCEGAHCADCIPAKARSRVSPEQGRPGDAPWRFLARALKWDRQTDVVVRLRNATRLTSARLGVPRDPLDAVVAVLVAEGQARLEIDDPRGSVRSHRRGRRRVEVSIMLRLSFRRFESVSDLLSVFLGRFETVSVLFRVFRRGRPSVGSRFVVTSDGLDECPRRSDYRVRSRRS